MEFRPRPQATSRALPPLATSRSGAAATRGRRLAKIDLRMTHLSIVYPISLDRSNWNPRDYSFHSLVAIARVECVSFCLATKFFVASGSGSLDRSHDLKSRYHVINSK